MKKIAGNDLLEIFDVSRLGEPHLQIQHNPLDALDGRACLTVDLIRVWGGSHLFSEALKGMGEEKITPTTIGTFVSTCVDVAESAYDELERRGWLIRVPKQGE